MAVTRHWVICLVLLSFMFMQIVLEIHLFLHLWFHHGNPYLHDMVFAVGYLRNNYFCPNALRLHCSDFCHDEHGKYSNISQSSHSNEVRTGACLECCPLCIEVIKRTKSETHDTINVTTRYCSGAWWFVWFTSFKFDFSWHTVSGFRRPASTYVILNGFMYVTDWHSTCFRNLSCANRASLLSFVVLSFRSPFSISGEFFQSPYFVISSVIFF